MRASSAFIFECGITTSSWPACKPLRMRVRKSAIGSVIDIGLDLPTRLLDARDQALVRDLAQADPAQPELAEVRARATAALAAVVVARRVLRRARLLYTLGSLGHLYSVSGAAGSSRVAGSSPSSVGRGGVAYTSGFSSFSCSRAACSASAFASRSSSETAGLAAASSARRVARSTNGKPKLSSSA